MYVTELVVEFPPLVLGMPEFGSKGMFVSAPEIPKVSQIVATCKELNPKVILSAASTCEDIA